MDTRLALAFKGVPCVLMVDPVSKKIADLYLPKEAWDHLLARFDSNHLDVALRGPHDYRNDMIMPPHLVMEKLEDWLSNDGTLEGAIGIADEVMRHAE